MTSYHRTLNRGLAHLTARAPAAITWKGAEYTGTASTVKREVQIDPAGNPVLITLTLYLSRLAFLEPDGITPTAIPKSGDTITHNATPYKIVQVTASDAHLEILCRDPHSGR